jgi:cyclopropane fatty-acyl-phospholipid synthase-like methyltransferase
MGFFDTPEGVKRYIRMAEGFDGRELIGILDEYLDPGSTVLEIGMGPGKDLEILSRKYHVTGSDLSGAFLDHYRNIHPDADLLKLDAVSLDTVRRFDCLYSNKVLHHLSGEELRNSLKRQREVLIEGGIALHTFWRGDKVEEIEGLLFVYYTEERLMRILKENFEVLRMEVYREMEEDDSIVVVLRSN